jgi:hypothetical protein
MDSTDSTAGGNPFTGPNDELERARRGARRIGVYNGLTTLRRALRNVAPERVAAILEGLVVVDDIGPVLRCLEDAADQAVRQ